MPHSCIWMHSPPFCLSLMIESQSLFFYSLPLKQAKSTSRQACGGENKKKNISRFRQQNNGQKWQAPQNMLGEHLVSQGLLSANAACMLYARAQTQIQPPFFDAFVCFARVCCWLSYLSLIDCVVNRRDVILLGSCLILSIFRPARCADVD